MNLEKLATEQVNRNTLDIDQKSTEEILKIINGEDKMVASAVANEIHDIISIADAMYMTLLNNGRIIYVGAGTSGRLGVLDAAECPPTFGIDRQKIIAIIAGGTDAMTRAIENAEDSETLSKQELQAIELEKSDMVIGIAASGRTPYVVSAMKFAKDLGCNTAAITASKQSELGKVTDYKVEVNVGPEVITGSTRMKAGTAQKLILNMLSTTVMIKLGRVYNNEMVSLIATNKKLEVRSRNILKRILEVDDEQATDILAANNYDLKLSILVAVLGVSYEQGLKLLEENASSIKAAINSYV
ncbi:MAG: N-acetylmuramic acid 6-phosphate etherase [Bacilli bacterium]